LQFSPKNGKIIPMSRNSANYNLIPQNSTQKMPTAFFATDLGNRHTPTTAPRQGVFMGKCGMVRGQMKAQVKENASVRRQQATGNRQQAIILIL